MLVVGMLWDKAPLPIQEGRRVSAGGGDSILGALAAAWLQETRDQRL